MEARPYIYVWCSSVARAGMEARPYIYVWCSSFARTGVEARPYIFQMLNSRSSFWRTRFSMRET